MRTRYLPYIELGCWLGFAATFSWKFSQADNSKTIQHRSMTLTSLDSLGSWKSKKQNILKKTFF